MVIGSKFCFPQLTFFIRGKIPEDENKQTNTNTCFKKLACWKILSGCFHFMVKENYSLEKTLVRSNVLGWTKREVRVGGGVGVGVG